MHEEGHFPYDEQARKGTLRHLVLRESKANGRIMVIVETKGTGDHRLGDLYRRLTEKTPRISSLWRAINDRPGSYIDYSRLSHEGGERYLDESLAGLTLRVYPASFFQPNPAGAALIYERVGRVVRELKAANILGLYCGMAPPWSSFCRGTHKTSSASIPRGRTSRTHGRTRCSTESTTVPSLPEGSRTSLRTGVSENPSSLSPTRRGAA